MIVPTSPPTDITSPPPGVADMVAGAVLGEVVGVMITDVVCVKITGEAGV